MNKRGQTLVLFCLTLLLLVLMVAMTLSMGSRTKEKMELQTAADAAAYNGAVATARTFNSISVMNRVQAAHAISTLGTLSLISWSTLYWKHADNAAKLFRLMAFPYGINTLLNCLPPPPRPLCRPCAQGFAQALALAVLSSAHASTTKSRLRRDAQLFTAETRPRWEAARQIHQSQLELLRRLDTYLSPTGSTGAVLASAQLRASSEIVVPDAAWIMSAREISDAINDSMGPVAGAEPHHLGHILMGSRGHPFVRDREEHDDWDVLFSGGSISMRGMMVFAGGHVFYSGSEGQSYYDRTWNVNPSGRIYGPLAHDGAGGRTRVFFVPASRPFRNWVRCSSPLPAFIISEGIGLMGRSVGMGSAQVSADRHEGIGHNVQHAFRTFPPFIDYNSAQLLDMDNLHGQPKIVTVIGRDIRGADIFEPTVDLKFNPSGTGGRLQMGATPVRQLAIGSGLVYYHRFGHALEPPNFFAPFWRGGLTRYSVDRPAPGSATRGAWNSDTYDLLLQSGSPQAAEAFRELDAVGYGGFQ